MCASIEEDSEEQTPRQLILSTLNEEGAPLTVRGLSGILGMPEEEVVDHLEHLRRSLRRSNQRLKIIPAECRKCGFVFEKRDRFSKPGKCPNCRATYISEPEVLLETKGGGRD